MTCFSTRETGTGFSDSYGHSYEHSYGHGGNLDAAVKQYGGDPRDWIDLSTGINRSAYPLKDIPAWQEEAAFCSLPTRQLVYEVEAAARATYQTKAPITAMAGVQAAIQCLPSLLLRALKQPLQVKILGPTYAEYHQQFSQAGWSVETVPSLEALTQNPSQVGEGTIAIVVNPNNPDGRLVSPQDLWDLAAHVQLLIIDESFADPHPGLSLAPWLNPPMTYDRPDNTMIYNQPDNPGYGRLLVLRSFGKFYGLAGLRLGFALGDPALVAGLRAQAGAWAVSSPALVAGLAALKDQAWRQRTIRTLKENRHRLDQLARAAGFHAIGQASLFGLYETGNAAQVQEQLAGHHIWSRSFTTTGPNAQPAGRLRLGLPAGKDEWQRLAQALDITSSAFR